MISIIKEAIFEYNIRYRKYKSIVNYWNKRRDIDYNFSTFNIKLQTTRDLNLN